MASGCEKGFVKCFLKVPLAILSSMAAGSVELSENILQNPFTNLKPQTVCSVDTFPNRKIGFS